MKRPVDYERHTHGDGKRFQFRTYNNGMWQVFSDGLIHICECSTSEMAEMIADALERDADYDEAARLVDKVFGKQGE